MWWTHIIHGYSQEKRKSFLYGNLFLRKNINIGTFRLAPGKKQDTYLRIQEKGQMLIHLPFSSKLTSSFNGSVRNLVADDGVLIRHQAGRVKDEAGYQIS
jgi:hypothetical protein